jgi:hypothetical protein
MTTLRTKLTIEQKIEKKMAELKQLRAAKRDAKRGKKKEITRDSEGMASLLNAIEAAAKANKVKKPVIIRAVAKLTRSGLKFLD